MISRASRNCSLDTAISRPLKSWGKIGGYACDFNDDAICDLILAEIYHPKNLKVA